MAELIVAVLIGALVLSILMSFITTSMNEITYSNKQTEVIEKINAFSTSINNYKWTFWSVAKLIDNSSTWSDVLIMTDPDDMEGIILWVVNESTLMLEQGQEQYETIYEKYLGIRPLTAADITSLNADPSSVYNLNFNKDKLFWELVMKDFQANSYNSWALIDTNLEILINYKDSVDGQKWDDISNDWIYGINLNF